MVVTTSGQSVARPVSLEGFGLFSSIPTRVSILPAPAHSGLTFCRIDTTDRSPVPAHVRHVLARPRHTVLSPHPGQPGEAVHTVEHILSALVAMGITDARIEIDGPEIPLLDGSALPFVRALSEAGLVEIEREDRAPIVVTSPIVLSENGSRIEAHPADGPWLDLEYHLDYGPHAGPDLGPQTAQFRMNWHNPDVETYAREIAPARTFCTQAEAQELRNKGFFAHLEPRDVLVIAPTGPVETAFRLGHEPARHKVLDMLGDLALAARPIHAKITATKAGHALNHAMARALL